MKKYKLDIVQKIELRHEITVAVPDDMDDEEFNEILSRVESQAGWYGYNIGDFADELRMEGLSVVDVVDNEETQGNEIEIIDTIEVDDVK